MSGGGSPRWRRRRRRVRGIALPGRIFGKGPGLPDRHEQRVRDFTDYPLHVGKRDRIADALEATASAAARGRRPTLTAIHGTTWPAGSNDRSTRSVAARR